MGNVGSSGGGGGGGGGGSAGYYPPPPGMPVYYHPALARHHQYPSPAAAAPVEVEHHKAVTVRSDVNVRKETLRLDPDDGNPGRRLLAFAFDAVVPGSITVYFFAQEDADYNLKATKEGFLKPVTVSFKEGQGQEFRQPCGTGIDVSMFEESELTNVGEGGVFPIAVKVEVSTSSNQGQEDEKHDAGASNSRIILAVFEKKDDAKYRVRVAQQILWVSGNRYVLQEIYGIGNLADANADVDDSGQECVVCLSEPRDTTVLPCRHMCLCRECARVLRLQTKRCPICRLPVERLLEIEVDGKSNAQQAAQY